jgi:excisionase family DNA binding protein
MAKAVTVGKLLYTPVEAAHALGVSRSTIYMLMANGHVPSVRIGASRRVPAEGLREFISGLGAKASSGTKRAKSAGASKQQPLWEAAVTADQ